ncbi:enoyl-CoA hydratase/carnithine racemase [Pseudochelatococcus lubricantis]|uniref:Enoyl-CoA hydratase/carnithine racemase n=1 Tax=Pseudochelatococcus lubricantis TaxID=1538102 RepID=A0ABX0UYD9_9HYPH|nr:enoyl-CoA hydratase-related protein [Pseudochelatococcus lubricantis]NIJ57946.1 enoyl-CoA hydratase/carnithine racemase [Pseudochelatococcus lubricantis]
MTATVLASAPASGVRLLTISRPERRNALDRSTYALLGASLAEADRDASVAAIVLTGAGNCFTSGNDIADFRTDDTQDAEAPTEPAAAVSSPGLSFLRDLVGVSKPVIAAVEGFAVGIGTTLLLHCDLAYAGQGARFRLPFVRLGLCPEGSSTYLLPLLAGQKLASELLLIGDEFPARVAAQAGIVNAVTEDGQSLETAIEKAARIAALSPEAVLATKKLLRRGYATAISETLEEEARHFHALRRSEAAQQAFRAFLSR